MIKKENAAKTAANKTGRTRNMAGYADDYSRSIGAEDAEADGKLPASRLARKLKVKTGAIQALLRSCEWHHTSSHYNCTDYYDLGEARERLDELRAWYPPAVKKTIKTDCTVTWLEWGGTRKRPTATECTADGCTVERASAAFVLITLPNGQKMRKKLGSTGLIIN